MGHHIKYWYYIASVKGTSQGNCDTRLVHKRYSQYDGLNSQDEALAAGRKWAIADGWNQIISDNIIESQSLEH